MSPSKPADRLDSWKAIARHINRSERTARRWEAEEGMPVHRHMHQSQASVYAYVSELDAWMVRWESSDGEESSGPAPAPNPEQASIAVLPFDFVGSDATDSYIADGFTDEIIVDLAKVDSLRVISRTSSMQLKGQALGVGDIAGRLGVRYLLEGSVRRHNDAIRVSAQLLEPRQDRQIWSEKYSGSINEVFEIQERIARDVAAAMRLRLTSADETRLSSRDINDWSAWLAAVQARQETLRWTREGNERAIGLLENALATSPNVPYLYTALGKTYLHSREAGFDLSERPLTEAQGCVDKAIALDPGGAGGYELLGWLHYSKGEIQQAVEDLKAAFSRQRPNPDTLGLLCNCYLISGQMQVARSLVPQVLAMDPLSPAYRALPLWADVLEGRHADAVAPYREMLRQEPDSPLFRLFLVWILAINGLTSEVGPVADGYPEADADSLPARVAQCFSAACRGETPEIQISAEDRELASINDMYPRMLAQAYALADEADAAIEWLRLAVSRGFINYPYLEKFDPLLTRLSSHAEYRELLEAVRQRWTDFAA